MRQRTASAWPYRALTLVIFAVAWEVWATGVHSLLVPTFTETATATLQLLTAQELWAALFISNQALFIGFGLAIVLGVPLGLLLGRSNFAERATNVYLNVLLVTPMAALIPLLMLSVGIGLSARVIVVCLFSIVVVVINTRAGIRQVDARIIEMARSFGASEFRIWQRVLLPGATPAIMTGVRIGLGRAVTGMVIVELLLVSVGLGGLVLKYRGTFQPDFLYGTIVIVVLESVFLIAVARRIERRLAPWVTQEGLLSS